MKSESVKPWVIDDGMVDVSDQAQMLLDNIGTDRAWVAVGINDEEGFAEVVALTHPVNAPLISAAPELLSALADLVEAHTLEMGKSAIQLRLELAKDALAKAHHGSEVCK